MKYYINTFSDRVILYELPENYMPAQNMILQFDLIQVDKFTYTIYKYLRINLKAEDKFKWLKLFIKGKFNV